MKSTKHSPPPELSTLRVTLDLARIPGDRVAAIIEEVHDLCDEQVLLTELRSQPVSLELTGPRAALERLRTTMLRDGLRRVPSSWRMTVGSIRHCALASAKRSRVVLLVDGDDMRARRDVEVLHRARIDACVVGSVGAAVVLLQRSALPLDAVVVRHHLPEGNGLQVLDRVRPEQRRCSVLVIDDKARPEIARAYRVRGAFRYVQQPEGPLQLIGRVQATVLDTQAWRKVEEPSDGDGDEPPRMLVDPERAAARLQHVCGLSSLEREVAGMVLRGLRDLEIADYLGKSERTAKRHVGKVLEKAGIGNRASLWSVVYQDGIGDGIGDGIDDGFEASPSPASQAQSAQDGDAASGEALPLGGPGTAPSSRPSVGPGPLHANLPAA